MKILKNRTWQGIQRKLAENEKVIKWWQENHKKCEKTISDLEVKLSAKEQECRNLMNAPKNAEAKQKLTIAPPKEPNLKTLSPSTSTPINVSDSLNTTSLTSKLVYSTPTKSVTTKKSSKK